MLLKVQNYILSIDYVVKTLITIDIDPKYQSICFIQVRAGSKSELISQADIMQPSK